MTEGRPTDLVYGHFGYPVYDTESQQWHFPRQTSGPAPIQPVGTAYIVFGPSTEGEQLSSQKAVDRNQAVKDVIKQHPTLISSLGLIPGFLQESEATISSISQHDPAKSELYALGHLIDEAAPLSAAGVPISAAVAGPAGELVRLILLRNEQLHWDVGRLHSLNRFTARGGEQAWWKGSGSPILQLCFHVGPEGSRGPSLAVRCLDGVAVLKPSLRTEAVYRTFDPKSDILSSVSGIDVKEVAFIESSYHGNAPFVDVSFNPWNSEQIATIDQYGSFNVWALERSGKRRSRRTIKRIYTDSIAIAITESADVASSQGPTEGWAKTLWACDPTILLVASRRSLSILSTEVHLEDCQIPELGLQHSTDWILDIQRVPNLPAYIFLVTSTRLFWLEIAVTEDSEQYQQAKARVVILLAWVHYRSPTDKSLSLDIVVDDDDDTSINVLLYSRIASDIIVFTFGHADSHNQAKSLLDPYILSVKNGDFSPQSPASRGSGRCISLCTVVLQSLGHRRISDDGRSSPLQWHVEDNSPFYQLSALYSDLSLKEGLYVRSPLNNAEPTQEPRVMINERAQSQSPTPKAGFVVPDVLEYQRLRWARQAHIQQVRAQEHSAEQDEDDPRTINFQWLIDIVSTLSKTAGESTSTPDMTIQQASENIQAVIEGKDSSDTFGIETLLGLIKSDISFDDVDDAAAEFGTMLDSFGDVQSDAAQDSKFNKQSSNIPLPLITPATDILSGDTDIPEFRRIYDLLMQSYLSPLPRATPLRARTTLEAALRKIAAQLFLTSKGLRLSPPSQNSDAGGLKLSAQSQKNARFDLPVRGKAPDSYLNNEKGKGKALPDSDLPRNIATVSESAVETSPEDPASQRLRHLVTLTPQPPLSTKLTQLLAHWDIGADPATYDWAAKQQQILATDPESEEEQSESSQLKKKAIRRKRLRESSFSRELSGGNVGVGGSEPSMEVARSGGSQPVDGGESGQGGTATQDGGFAAMSQPVPGRHAARLGKDGKKRKKRKEGF